MSELVFATYLKEVKKAWKRKISDQDIVQLFYDAVAKPMGYDISVRPDTASKVMNRKPSGNVRDDIREGSTEDKVLAVIEGYFAREITSNIPPRKVDAIIERLAKLVNEDVNITDVEKSKILNFAKSDTLNDFLIEIYFYTIMTDNALPGASEDDAGVLEVGDENELEVLPVPTDVMEEERKYVGALLAAYGQLRKTDAYDLVMLDSYEDDKKNFDDNREYYFAAEALRRGTRDSNYGENQFNVLKREIYEGVKEIWDRHYVSGCERLNFVLNESMKANINQCVLSRKTNWIGNFQRKGVCHFLVNDGTIEGWVRDDDGQTV